jgi:uncharacterized paraquat-inducible protein A
MFLNVARILSQLYELIRVRPRSSSDAAAPPVSLRPVKCKHCAAAFSVPEISTEQRSVIATLVRANRVTLALGELHNMVWKMRRSRWPIIFQIFFPLNAGPFSRDCIQVIRHITWPAGVCSHCKTHLPGPGQSECPNCHALTVDW